MSRRGYSREDVETHSDGFGRDRRPAVNVKVYGSVWDVFAKLEKASDVDIDDARFTREWFEAHVSDEALDALFWHVCESEFEMVEQDAREIFGAHVKVWQEGRSGGWAVVDGLADLDEWDAVALAKWRKFERWAKLYAADVPYQMVASVFYNEFAVWSDEGDDASPANSEVPVDLKGALCV